MPIMSEPLPVSRKCRRQYTKVAVHVGQELVGHYRECFGDDGALRDGANSCNLTLNAYVVANIIADLHSLALARKWDWPSIRVVADDILRSDQEE